MFELNTSQKRRASRAFIWFTLYYALLIFNAVYLAKIEDITGANVVLVFLPLIILAISAESMSEKMRGERINLQPWAGMDFGAKVFAYIFGQLIYRFPQDEALTVAMWVLVALWMVVSLAMEIPMLVKSSGRPLNPQVRDMADQNK